MSSKAWLISFISIVVLTILLIAGLNVCADPFGVFGDKFYNWYSFNMTENPRAAKIAYLDKNHQSYNAYVLGASGTSSLSPEKLKKYTGEDFYNLFVYGADMRDTEAFARYVIDNYGAKSIVLNMSLACAVVYGEQKTDVTRYMHANVDGAPKPAFYAKYMFANPRYALRKVYDSTKRSYLQQPFSVFIAETGTYDKTSRDVEAFGALNEYFSQYPVFNNVNTIEKKLVYIDECVASVAAIKRMCEEAGVSLTVIFPPMYAPDAAVYDAEKVSELFVKLAEVTDFWDFSLSPLSADPRYFYDTTHFRNAAGDMMLARIYGDSGVYIPEGFGTYVTTENARMTASEFAREWTFDGNDARIPVLLYHHLAEQGDGGATISEGVFEEHIRVLAGAGYNAILPEDLVDYVEKGEELPENPILITFDDGYMSNYEIAYPILEKYGMKAAVFVIGVSFGKDTYKDTGTPIIPHFGAREAEEMSDSGVITIQSHTYDMHNSEQLDDPKTFRRGVLRKKGESERDYKSAYLKDISDSQGQIYMATGVPVDALAYPFGMRDTFSDVLSKRLGIKVTFITEEGVNTVVKGLPQTLVNLKRFTITENVTPEELLQKIGQ